jgi:hypothetical protein
MTATANPKSAIISLVSLLRLSQNVFCFRGNPVVEFF